MHNFNEFLRRDRLRRLATGARVDHVLANMILDYLSDESVQSSAAGRGLLQDIRTFVIGMQSALNRFDLAAQAFHTIQELHLFFRNVTHGSNTLFANYTPVGYIKLTSGDFSNTSGLFERLPGS